MWSAGFQSHMNHASVSPTDGNGPTQRQRLYKGRYTRGSLLLQHAPATRSRSKAPSSAPTISSEKICCAAKLLLPSFAPSYQTGLIWGSKLQGQICCTGLFQEQAPSCALKFACRDMTCLQSANQIGLFFSSTTVPMPQSGCFIIQLPRRVLRVYWLGYLPGSVCRERVSGASSLVCAGLKRNLSLYLYMFIAVTLTSSVPTACSRLTL